jgi:hypothetical protein
MHCTIRVVETHHPALRQIGAAAGRRGDELVVLVAAGLSVRERVGAVSEVLTDEEWDAFWEGR